jgi:hypothetical protein
MIKHGVRLFFFTLSLFFLGAHSLLPHNHDQLASHDHSALPSWVDFLADLVNGTDLGNEHLEDYRTQETVLQLAVPFAHVLSPLQDGLITLLAPQEESELPTREGVFPVRDQWLSLPAFRGPPLI